MSARRIAVVSAGLSTPSSTRMLADRLAASTVGALGQRGVEASTQVIELRDHAHAITDHMLSGFASTELDAAMASVASADALIAVTPVFTAGYSGLFKSFLDVFDKDALAGMPVLLAATAGTARHSLVIDYAMRPVFAYLHAQPVSTGVFASSADWGEGADEVATLADRIEKGAGELADAVAAARPRRAADPMDPGTYLKGGDSFADLLGRVSGR